MKGQITCLFCFLRPIFCLPCPPKKTFLLGHTAACRLPGKMISGAQCSNTVMLELP